MMMKQIPLTLTLVVAFTTLVFAGDNRPQFRGPDGMGHSDATGLPLTWSESQNIKWKTPIHGKGWSSPVIWGSQIWMTIATEDASFYSNPGVDLRGMLRALWINLRGGETLSGGSTITQQVARTLLLSDEKTERTLRRKLRETVLAW